jgi:hypothetical protein
MQNLRLLCRLSGVIATCLFAVTTLGQFKTSTVSILAIFPNNAISPGANFVIRGHGFAGHNAIWLEDVHGPGGLIGEVDSSDDTSITAKLDSFDLCLENRHEAGRPCGAHVTIEPRAYRIYVSNESGASNRVLVVVRRSPSSLSMKEPLGNERWKIGEAHRISWSGPTKGIRYQFLVQSASVWWETHSIAPSVVGKSSITWTAGTACGLEGCSVGLPPGKYYVVVEDAESAVQTWSGRPISLVP